MEESVGQLEIMHEGRGILVFLTIGQYLCILDLFIFLYAQ